MENTLGFYRNGVLSVPSPSKRAHLLKIKGQQGFRQTTELSANKIRFCFHLKLTSLSSHSTTVTSTITTMAVWGSIRLTGYRPSPREVRAGTQAEIPESCCVACPIACSDCFLTTSKTTCPGWHYPPGLGSPTQPCLWANLMGVFSLLKFPLLK